MQSFFCQSGTEAVEGALKLARYVTGRPRFIGFLGGFHGRTMGSLAFTASKYTQQEGFRPTMPGVTHVPYPNPYRPLFAGADQGEAVLEYIRMLFQRNVPASEVAAILVEPIQGEGGYLVPPDGFLAGLRALVRPARHPADIRRSAIRHRPHRQDVRLRALGRRAGHHDPRQRPGLRYADRRGGRQEAPHGKMEARRPRQHLRRQSDVLRGGAGDTRPGSKPIHRQCRSVGAYFMSQLARAWPRNSMHRRGPRQRPDDRHGTDRTGPDRTPAPACAMRC